MSPMHEAISHFFANNVSLLHVSRLSGPSASQAGCRVGSVGRRYEHTTYSGFQFFFVSRIQLFSFFIELSALLASQLKMFLKFYFRI